VGILPWKSRADDSGCPKGAEEGNVVSVRHKAHALDECSNHCISIEDASFARSFDTCTSILTTHRGARLGGGADDSASRLGKPTEVGETCTGVERTDVARLAACHCFRKGVDVTRRRKGRRSRSPSLRGSKSSGQVARTSIETLQKSLGAIWPRISSANALQKERTGSSEQGPSSK
jgi:hypothetical protein